MAKVFVSYSRKDIEFAKRLTAELQKSDLDFWIDWKGIPPTVDWWKEIEKGIEEADGFLFLISPDSANSKVCQQEIEHAVKNGKRLIPLIIRETKGSEVPSQLTSLNWIFFRKEDDFDASITKLLTSIHTDYDWVQIHRRLQVRALDWERSQKENSFLLRGKDLQEAEFQLATNSSKEPYPTELQREYVSSSRTTDDMQRRSSRLRRNAVAFIGVILLLTIGLAATGKLNRFIYRPVEVEGYWVTIPAGAFQMGSENGNPDEYPVHTVYLDEYKIGKYEVSNLQYVQCVKAGTCNPPINKIYTSAEYELHPLVDVEWDDANTYCKWVGGRLPTEAEWEKAASWDDKTKTKRTYPWGETIDCSHANYSGHNACVSDTTPVGSYENGKSSYGLYDMAGNVWEWVNDWYSETYYQSSPSSNPQGPDSGDFRVVRGGAVSVSDNGVRSASRFGYLPLYTGHVIGFRCARDSSP